MWEADLIVEATNFARPCPDCLATVSVAVPVRATAATERQWLAQIRAQVPWPLLCPSCKGWWHGRVGVELSNSTRSEVTA
jgi:hypothetical protein